MRKIAINLILVISSLLIFEILSSIFFVYRENKYGFLFKPFLKLEKKYQIDYKINWNYKTNKVIPGVYQQDVKGKKITYTINSKGFRNKEFQKEKKSKYRIISFGGSTTMGLESPDDKTYPAQLEKLLKLHNIDVEVLNFGFASKSLNFVRQLLYSEAFNYDPDFISIYSNRNATMYDSIGTKINIKDQMSNAKFVKIIFILSENIMTFRLLFKTYRKLKSWSVKSGKIISPYNDNSHNVYYFTNQYKETLEEIIKFCNLKSIQVILIKQPIYIKPAIQQKIINKSIDDLLLILINLNNNNFFNLSYHDSFWILTNSILNKNIDRLSNYENVTIVDPTKILLSDKNNFSDYLHLTSKGNSVLAKKISDVLIKRLD